VLNVASNSHWDLIVFDECHKLSAYDYGQKQYLSLRYKAAEVLAKQSEHLLLLTATPHRGRTDTFKKLLQLLDEDIFATDEIASKRIKELEHNGINKFFIRRLKEDMKDWQGKPLFKNRFTKTVAYQLTPEEKELYEAVTDYLTKRKQEATESHNIHVSLALTVMQRRLVSSIFAIKNTLERRWKALQSIVDETNKNPNLWNQRHKLEGFDVDNIEEFEELDDDERDALENILSDPRKFKLFTTTKSFSEITQEANEVKRLFEMAQTLYNRQQEEKKFLELQELLKSNGVLEHGEKLVIFTEHKDTLLYLEERLTRSGGYKVATIHGGKSVDERREAQWSFAKPDTQILIGTDAAGEGINLQFCRLLINWDIPWNPNRLEQRMGRIHRYGQKKDVLVFNMVANNTKEGKVLERLLTKLDIIREGMGDDRVYDVIQDVLEGVSLDAIINSVFNGKETDLDVFMDLQIAIQEMQSKVLLGDFRASDKIIKKQERINELIHKKESRLAGLDLMAQLSPKAPEVLGCAYVVPLTQVEYVGHYGMSRDDEAEAIAMKTAMDYEISSGWTPTDVSANNEGYDIRSISPEEIKRYIEVKGRSAADGSVMLSENEMNRLAQLGDAAWLYIVLNCKSKPELYCIQNPAKTLNFELKSKGVQYFLPMEEWKKTLS